MIDGLVYGGNKLQTGGNSINSEEPLECNVAVTLWNHKDSCCCCCWQLRGRFSKFTRGWAVRAECLILVLYLCREMPSGIYRVQWDMWQEMKGNQASGTPFDTWRTGSRLCGLTAGYLRRCFPFTLFSSALAAEESFKLGQMSATLQMAF